MPFSVRRNLLIGIPSSDLTTQSQKMPMTQDRRSFLARAAMAAGASLASPALHALAQSPSPTPQTPLPASSHPAFPTSDPSWQRTWDAAIATLAGNIHIVPRYDRPVLV